ncbi:MAG: hypothetical protein KBS76_07785 [Ruminococcus sp.]|nr:hypothetical protein [Candidatus Apopatosoma intestinale]
MGFVLFDSVFLSSLLPTRSTHVQHRGKIVARGFPEASLSSFWGSPLLRIFISVEGAIVRG